MGDNKARRPGRKLLTTFDIVLIAVVIVIAVLFLAWKASQSGSGTVVSVSTETVRYTVELNNMLGDPESDIAAGDALIETVKNTAVGSVVSCEVKNTVKWNSDLETGGMKMSETDMQTALVTIDAECTVTDAKIATAGGSVPIRVGESMGIAGPGYWGKGYIVAVERG